MRGAALGSIAPAASSAGIAGLTRADAAPAQRRVEGRPRQHQRQSADHQFDGSWDLRPGATTALPNLFLAGDYTRNNIDLACMEAANEGGRTAANAILDAAGSDERSGPARVTRLPKLGFLG